MSHFVCAWAVPKKNTRSSAMRTIVRSSSGSPRILAYFPQRDLGEGEAGGQPRRLDAEEMRQAGNAVRRGALDLEVGRRLARAGGLRPDAAVARQQRAVGQPRPVAPDRRVKARGAAGVDGVIIFLSDALHPFHV